MDNTAFNILGESYPVLYETLEKYHRTFSYKPIFDIGWDDTVISITRKDTQESQRIAKRSLGDALTISEYTLLAKYHGFEEICAQAVTNHDVYLSYDRKIITKTGNPWTDNAATEFSNSIEVKYFRGLIEMESPLGFFEPCCEDYSCVQYKALRGMSLKEYLGREGPLQIDKVNSLTWDIAKLFSRLITNNVFFWDTDRFNNYFIQDDVKGNLILRLLDGEYIMPKAKLEMEEVDHMLNGFLNEALKHPALMDKERIEDFLMVSIGDFRKMRHIRDKLDKPSGLRILH